MTEKQCAYELCGEQIPRKGRKKINKYCSSLCSSEDKKYTKIQSWIKGEWDGSTNAHGELSNAIKLFLIEEAGFKCTECGWDKINPTTGKCPLEVDHIDGNSTNNLRENLKVLCRNCHSLTPNFKALNQDGRGKRQWRKKYSQFETIGRKAADPQKKICECGGQKDAKAQRCRDCTIKAIKNSYPPLEEIVLGVEQLGFTKYGHTIGKSDSAIRNYLRENGIEVKRIKVVAKCHCGADVAKNGKRTFLKTCLEHRVQPFKYPPVEEIIEGIEIHGWTGYARNQGIPYASNIRKYLQRKGIDTNAIQKN